MITDIELCAIAESSYGPVTLESETCHALIVDREEFTVIAFRGTDPHRMIDLICDADATTVLEPSIGALHAGFYRGLCGIAWRLIPRLAGHSVVLTGHSKGGAEALIFAGMLAVIGMMPLRVTTFGAARPADPRLGGLIGALAGVDYRNGADPVPELPPTLAHPRPLEQIGDPKFHLNALADHALASYRAALTGISVVQP